MSTHLRKKLSKKQLDKKVDCAKSCSFDLMHKIDTTQFTAMKLDFSRSKLHVAACVFLDCLARIRCP